MRRQKILKILLISGIIIFFAGIWRLIGDVSSNSWCPGNEWACKIKNMLRAPVLLVVGFGLMSWPLTEMLITQLKNKRQ